jgi:hypothetical protein
MLPAAPPPVESVVTVRESALHRPVPAGAADVAGVEGEAGVEADGDADVVVWEGDGDAEVGGALLVPAGLGLGPQAATSSSEAAAVVVKSPVLMR